jgi:hypothetical protein
MQCTVGGSAPGPRSSVIAFGDPHHQRDRCSRVWRIVRQIRYAIKERLSY